MGLITEFVTQKWARINKKWYVEKGYIFTKIGDEFVVNIEDLTIGAKVKVDCECDSCNNVSKNLNWRNYTKSIEKTGKYFCNTCAYSLYGIKNRLSSKLKNGLSFEQWCIDNGKIDFLKRWNIELNDISPNEITHSSHIEVYINCPNGLHNPELKRINYLSSKFEHSYKCKQCNSFAQWGIDNLDEDFLEKYWDFEKNNELGIDPWKIDRKSGKKVWIKCQEKDYHGSYTIVCHGFVNNHRCSYCSNQKIHIKDSLAQQMINNDRRSYLNKVWSNKNKKTPYEYSPHSTKSVWWKCPNGDHEDFKRSIKNSNVLDFRCPNCFNYKGEKRIEEYLTLINVQYSPQQKFTGLNGVGGRLLSYDFFLTNYNLLIEYQGQYHDGTARNQTKDQYAIQQEHDRRKREYAVNNNINLLEIWYYDFDRIEEILSSELNIKSK